MGEEPEGEDPGAGVIASGGWAEANDARHAGRVAARPARVGAESCRRPSGRHDGGRAPAAAPRVHAGVVRVQHGAVAAKQNAPRFRNVRTGRRGARAVTAG